MIHPQLFVALDYTEPRDIGDKIAQLNEVKGNFGYKINADHIAIFGGEAINHAKRFAKGSKKLKGGHEICLI